MVIIIIPKDGNRTIYFMKPSFQRKRLNSSSAYNARARRSENWNHKNRSVGAPIYKHVHVTFITILLQYYSSPLLLLFFCFSFYCYCYYYYYPHDTHTSLLIRYWYLHTTSYYEKKKKKIHLYVNIIIKRYKTHVVCSRINAIAKSKSISIIPAVHLYNIM